RAATQTFAGTVPMPTAGDRCGCHTQGEDRAARSRPGRRAAALGRGLGALRARTRTRGPAGQEPSAVRNPTQEPPLAIASWAAGRQPPNTARLVALGSRDRLM